MENLDKNLANFVVQDWQKYYKEHYHLYKLSTNKLVLLDKPKIQTQFCFGYGMYGVGDNEDEAIADNNAESIKTKENYFIDRNLDRLNRQITWVSECDYAWFIDRNFDVTTKIYTYGCDRYTDDYAKNQQT